MLTTALAVTLTTLGTAIRRLGIILAVITKLYMSTHCYHTAALYLGGNVTNHFLINYVMTERHMELCRVKMFKTLCSKGSRRTTRWAALRPAGYKRQHVYGRKICKIIRHRDKLKRVRSIRQNTNIKNLLRRTLKRTKTRKLHAKKMKHMHGGGRAT